ncbi:MAG: hypothetical protein II871_05120 [Clostridia bacterium]|nr:hypothetical protein [Clostridia bacterium]
MKREEILEKARMEGVFSDERSRSIADKAGSFGAIVGCLLCTILYFALKAKGVHPAALSAIWLIAAGIRCAEEIYKSIQLKKKRYKIAIALRTLIFLLVLLLFLGNFFEWK